jgi:hypothetical protein
MEQLVCHWTDCHELWYLSIFQSSVMKIQASLKSDKNNGYFTRTTMYIYDNILLNSSQNEKYFRQKLQRKSKHIFYIQQLFSKKLCSLWNDMEKYGTAREATDNNRIWCTHIALRLQTHSGYVILNVFPRQQWLCKCAWMWCLHVHCLSCCSLHTNSKFTSHDQYLTDATTLNISYTDSFSITKVEICQKINMDIIAATNHNTFSYIIYVTLVLSKLLYYLVKYFLNCIAQWFWLWHVHVPVTAKK